MLIASLLLWAAAPALAPDSMNHDPMQQVDTTRAAPIAPATATTPNPIDKTADNKAVDEKHRPAKSSSRKGTFLVIVGIISAALGISILS